MRIRVALAFVLFVLLLALAASANAAFPGQNGKIAFQDYPGPALYTINLDGSGRTQLTADGANPAWSPDGTRIAFTSKRDDPNPAGCAPNCNSEIYVMNADGSNQTRLSNDPEPDWTPAWSPDGTKIAFPRGSCTMSPYVCQIRVMNADGSGQIDISNTNDFDAAPAWSPDGTKIAFSGGPRGLSTQSGLFRMNPDGSNQVQLTSFDSQTPIASGAPDWSPDGARIAYGDTEPTSTYQIFSIKPDGTGKQELTPPVGDDKYDPAWSPDGTRIAFAGVGNTTAQVYTMNADGSGQSPLTTGFDPSWQPLPTSAPVGYPRPKGATPFQTYLTVAYRPCPAPDRQHGPPLAVLSCDPPLQASSYLTVGTLDANGQAANAVGVYRLDVKPGGTSVPADVKITFALKDVRNKSDLSDYRGELRITENWRITDKDNGPSGGGGGSDPATVEDIPFPPLDVACAASADTTIGSSCNSVTSANAIVPGSIQTGKRMNGELGQVEVNDGGADGVAATETDNTLFMDQGIFVP